MPVTMQEILVAKGRTVLARKFRNFA